MKNYNYYYFDDDFTDMHISQTESDKHKSEVFNNEIKSEIDDVIKRCSDIINIINKAGGKNKL